MICLRCDNETFVSTEAEVVQEFKGRTLSIKTPVMMCQKCKWLTIGNDQIDELYRRTKEAYAR